MPRALRRTELQRGHHCIANGFDNGPRMVLDNFGQRLKMLLDQSKRIEVSDPIIEGSRPFQVRKEKSHFFDIDAFRPMDVFIPEKSHGKSAWSPVAWQKETEQTVGPSMASEGTPRIDT